MANTRPIDRAVLMFYGALAATTIGLFGIIALWTGVNGDVDKPYVNVGLGASWVITVICTVAILEYARRRPGGRPVTWGEAMFGATFAFFVMFWIYGVVPHQWLVFADSELNWRSDRLIVGWGLPDWWPGAQNQGILEWALPFELTYRVARDVIATVIYGALLVGQVALHIVWQNRGKVAEAAPVPTSRYGRPIVREGVNA